MERNIIFQIYTVWIFCRKAKDERLDYYRPISKVTSLLQNLVSKKNNLFKYMWKTTQNWKYVFNFLFALNPYIWKKKSNVWVCNLMSGNVCQNNFLNLRQCSRMKNKKNEDSTIR